MKDKIEKLIKEVGINEVESILNQIKSKVDIKEELKNDFIEMLTGCSISFDGDDIEFRKEGNLFFYYRKTNNHFRIIYKIWLKLQSKYQLNYQQLKDLFVDVVEEVLNYKGI